jgi:hypothetical protein
VSLDNSTLNLSLIGYTPQAGDSLTIITSDGGITGTFSQGNSITVNGFRFRITYNANSVVLTYAPSLGASRLPSPALSFQAEIVTRIYDTLLDHAPDPAGLTYWVQSIDSGDSTADVEHQISNSPEDRGDQVDVLYATYLHRSADPAGRAAWLAALGAGLSETAAALQFMMSPEYTQAHPDAISFVTGLYADVLGRTPDEVGLSVWVGAAGLGLGRADIANAFLYSLEASQRAVTGYYEQFLSRTPDAAGLAFWSAALQSRRESREQVTQAFLASDEFFALADNGQF